MAHEAGKGPSLRKGADLNKYNSNYDNIDWGKKEEPKQRGGCACDPSGSECVTCPNESEKLLCEK